MPLKLFPNFPDIFSWTIIAASDFKKTRIFPPAKLRFTWTSLIGNFPYFPGQVFLFPDIPGFPRFPGFVATLIKRNLF